ncbi:hypothetical protein QR680_009311 [Steinernema hermaphroditum]|uniref:Uncharacterized protein n=1 Tax=Steinernema hermaphroditum TaxID=289476 RepID=A0AA39IL80_9BILA|nr:hypothetical protein QR680_009311 [Steinernema hermaphroditum]
MATKFLSWRKESKSCIGIKRFDGGSSDQVNFMEGVRRQWNRSSRLPMAGVKVRDRMIFEYQVDDSSSPLSLNFRIFDRKCDRMDRPLETSQRKEFPTLPAKPDPLCV